MSRQPHLAFLLGAAALLLAGCDAFSRTRFYADLVPADTGHPFGRTSFECYDVDFMWFEDADAALRMDMAAPCIATRGARPDAFGAMCGPTNRASIDFTYIHPMFSGNPEPVGLLIRVSPGPVATTSWEFLLDHDGEDIAIFRVDRKDGGRSRGHRVGVAEQVGSGTCLDDTWRIVVPVER